MRILASIPQHDRRLDGRHIDVPGTDPGDVVPSSPAGSGLEAFPDRGDELRAE